MNLSIRPPNVPVPTALLSLDRPSKLFSNFFNNWVLSVADIDDYLFGFEAIGQLGDRNAFGGIVNIGVV